MRNPDESNHDCWLKEITILADRDRQRRANGLLFHGSAVYLFDPSEHLVGVVLDGEEDGAESGEKLFPTPEFDMEEHRELLTHYKLIVSIPSSTLASLAHLGMLASRAGSRAAGRVDLLVPESVLSRGRILA